MRELFLKTLKITDEAGAVRCYNYYILIGQMSVGAGSCESYGVKIAERGGDEMQVPDVTSSAARIDELCELLLRNTVTPASLTDVLSDWL